MSSSSRRGPRAVAVAFLVVAAQLAAQTMDVTLTLKGPPNLRAQARQPVTFAAVIRNEGDAAVELETVVVLPEGWRTLTGSTVFSLEGGQSKLTLVAVLVPSTALVGEYPVAYEVRDRATGTPLATGQVTVAVEPRVSVSLEVLERPQYAIAGDPYEVVLSLANTGNTDVGVDLLVTSSPRLPWSLGEESATEGWLLAPGARHEVRVLVQTDRGFHEGVSHRLRVAALPRDPPDGDPGDAVASTVVQVIPLSVGGASLRHTMRSVFTTTATAGLSEQSSASVAQTVEVHGSVDEAGRHLVEAIVTKRLSTDEPLLITPGDHYSLAYSGPHIETTLGDQDYQPPPLLAGKRAARGATAALDLRPVRLGLAAFPAVPNTEVTPILGASLEIGFPIAANAESHVYHAQLGFATNGCESLTLGLSQLARPMPGLTLGLDGGISVAGGLVRPALRGFAEGRVGVLSYAVRALRAWPGYVGTPTDAQSASGMAKLRLLDGALAVSGSLLWSENNLDLDPTQPSADRTLRGGLGVTGRLAALGSDVAAAVNLGRRVDRLGDPAYLIWDTDLNAGWRQKVGRVNLGLTGGLAYTLDETDRESAVRVKANASLGYLFAGGPRLGFASGYDGTLSSVEPGEHEINLRINFDYSWDGGALGAALNNRIAWGIQGFQTYTGGLSASLRATFRGGSSLEARLGIALSRDRVDWRPRASASALYRLSATIPLYRRHASAVVKGRLLEEPTGLPLAGVLVRLGGLAALTGEDGGFLFNLPQGGTYLLQVGGGDLPLGMIGAVPMPMLVDAPPGSTATVAVGMVRGASVAGSVTLWGAQGGRRWANVAATGDPAQVDAAAGLTGLGGLGGVLVEISGSGEVRRRLTSASGQFLFQDLRPGTYVVKVLQGQIPGFHRIEQDTQVLVLRQNDRQELAFRIVPEERQIKMVPSGDVILMTTAPPVDAGATLTLPAAPGGQPGAAEAGSSEPEGPTPTRPPPADGADSEPGLGPSPTPSAE